MDFIFEYWWIFLLPLIPIGYYFINRLEREYAKAMGLAAARLGLVFQKEDPFLPILDFALLTKRGSIISNVTKGEVGGSEMILLEYHYVVGFAEGGTRITQTVGAVRVAGLKLPAFLLEAKWAGFKGMKFDSHSQFSKKYRLTGADETAIRQLFGSYILEFFQHAAGESMECDGEWMIIYLSEVDVQADAGVSYREALMRKHLEETMRFLDVFRHST